MRSVHSPSFRRLSVVIGIAAILAGVALLFESSASRGAVPDAARASSAPADIVPDPAHCRVLPCDDLNGMIYAPDGVSPIAATICTITVRAANNNPINNALVMIEILPECPVRFCTTYNNQGTTNASGICLITLRGGGCCVAPDAGRVWANGVVIRGYENVKSPDQDADGCVNLIDLLAFRAPSHVPDCFDFNNDGIRDLKDLLIIAAGYVPPHCCTLRP